VTAFLPLAQAEWGTVPDWVTAFGTLAAFAVALRLLAKELAARREYEEDRRRDQARLVAAWVERFIAMAPTNQYVVVLRNGSEEPVYDLRVTMVASDSPFASDPEAVRSKDGTLKEAGPVTLTVVRRCFQEPHVAYAAA